MCIIENTIWAATWKPFLASAISSSVMLTFSLLFQGKERHFLITSIELASFTENVNLLIFFVKNNFQLNNMFDINVSVQKYI